MDVKKNDIRNGPDIISFVMPGVAYNKIMYYERTQIYLYSLTLINLQESTHKPLEPDVLMKKKKRNVK